MTEEANAGAAAAGTSEGANAAAAANGSQAAGATDFLAGLQNAESRAWVESKGIKSIDPLVESARYADGVKKELDDFKAKALTPPAPDAKPEEWNAFYAKMGRPEKAEAYDFKMPEGLPADLPYDGDSATAYKAWAHEAGLSPRQAQQLHDRFVSHQAGAYTKQIEQVGQRMEGATGELAKVWGDPSSEGFKSNVQFADRFIKNNGGEALLTELKANGLLAPNGAVMSPMLAQAMAKAGRAYAEDSSLATGAVAQGQKSAAETLYPNDPFKR